MKKKYTLTDRLITRITGWLSALIIVALAIWGVVTLWGFYRFEQTNDAQIDEYVTPIISRAGGFITTVRFEENQPVKKGDTLLMIDNRACLLQQQQTAAAIQKCSAQLQLMAHSRLTAEKAMVQAELTRLQALLQQQQLDLDNTIITAPNNGSMGRRIVSPNQMINAGDILAYIVNDETDKWVVANFKETQVANMHIGDSVALTVDAYPGRQFTGTIISFSPATGSRFSLLPPDNATGNFVKIVQRIPVRIRIHGSREELCMLKAGMNVNVSVPKKQQRG
jgi:multidrug resistance efflux pump